MSLPRRLIFELFYLGKPRWDTGITPPELMEFVASHPAGRALELGCGTGLNAIYLAHHGWQVTAVDFVGKAIRKAHRKARHAGVQVDFRQEEVTRLKGIHGPFDLVLDIGCFHNLDSGGRVVYVKNLERLLAPGGFFLLYTFLNAENRFKSGISPADIKNLESVLNLVKRVDGSERRLPSAWFTFKKDP